MAIPELLKTIVLNRLVDQGVRRIDRFYGTDTEREEDEDKGFGFTSQQRPGGLGSIIGPNGNFSSLPDISKWILTLGMILGRLELFAILVLFLPSFWRN